MPASPWKTINSRVAYQTPWLRVHEDQVITPLGQPGQYSYVETRGHAVYVLAATEEQKIYLINLYRYPQGAYAWEIPAGNAEGQPLLLAAQRELVEETGLTAASWQAIGRFVSCSGVMKEWSHVFLARGLTQTNRNQQAEEGIATIAPFSLAEISAMQQAGSFCDGQSMSALWLAKAHLT